MISVKDWSERFLRVQLICLSLIGVGQNESVSNRVLFHMCLISMAVMDLAAVLFALENTGNIILVCDCLGPLFTCYLAIQKQLCLNANRTELWEIINKLRKLRSKAQTQEVHIFDQSIKIDQRLAIAFLTTSSITASLFVVTALVKGLYSTIIQNDANWNFPLSLRFSNHNTILRITQPTINESSAMFLLYRGENEQSMYQYSYIYIYIVASVSSDAIFAGLISSIVVHFRCIQMRFKDRDFTDQDESLLELIEYHKLVLHMSRSLMSSFRMIIFQNLLVASILLCTLGFQLVMFLGSSIMLIYIVYVSAIVIQITFFSYFGSRILHESTLVADAIYCSNWYKASPKVRKVLLLCMMRAQIPVNVKAVFIVASLPTMRAIMNSAGSYITLLLSLT
ncbi:odorant receptor 82a-like [Malaya genurostris]|uniref:odorant receptor 82a-like n=1 Tax=Malaya genurostris TaxID=325434 RepID=UPI0026F3CEEF|nr:odorant receptor 82a-like [Malaya genurostris]